MTRKEKRKMSKIIRVEGCRDCPNRICYGFKAILVNYCPIVNSSVNDYVDSDTINPDCPLNDLSNAEARLKRCMEARKDELAYARREGYEKAYKEMQGVDNSKPRPYTR